ncbi:HIT family protein [Parapedomonas caeni]
MSDTPTAQPATPAVAANDTIVRFGFPATLVADYAHWQVLLRPAQPTLGSLILAAKSDAIAFSALPTDAFAELARVSADIESVLRRLVAYEKLNYLMLMMVDPHVHFHVIPRYSGSRTACGLTITDSGWPKTPDLGAAINLDTTQVETLSQWLTAQWPTA